MNNILNFVLQAMGGGVNPQQTVQQLIAQNPQAQILFNQMQQSGMSMKDFTLQFARQNNINLEPVLQQLNQRGIKL